MHTNKVHTPERCVYVSNSISRYFWKMKPRVIYSVKICRHWSNVLYRISIIFVIRNKTVQNLSFKDSEVEVCSSITPWLPEQHGAGTRETHWRTTWKSSAHHVNRASLPGWHFFLHQRCPTELPALMEMFSTCAVWISSHQPQVAFEHLKYGNAIPELEFTFNWNSLQVPVCIQLRFFIFKP